MLAILEPGKQLKHFHSFCRSMNVSWELRQRQGISVENRFSFVFIFIYIFIDFSAPSSRLVATSL